jgi:predicted dehydrogenase
MKEKERKIGVIGAGGRSHLLENVTNKHPGIKISSVFDPDKERSKSLIDATHSVEAKICGRFEDVIEDKNCEWIAVFSPNHCHKEHIIAAFEAGKHVFAEKPLATTIDDCEAIYKAHKKTSLLFATGFVLRYSPLYRKVKEILESGEIGKILSIDANENVAPDHGSYIMKNWRRLAKFAGPHILEKCCHDLDLLNWFIESLPSKAASFGGLDFFTPENKHIPSKIKIEGQNPFAGWPDPHGVACPFESEKDIIDNQVAILQYRNKVRVTFQATLSNAIPERRMYFSCTEGTMIAELYSLSLKVAKIGEKAREIIFSGDMHGGGDGVIASELADSILNSSKPKSSGVEGLRGSVVALAIDEARLKEKVFDLEPVWKRLGQ